MKLDVIYYDNLDGIFLNRHMRRIQNLEQWSQVIQSRQIINHPQNPLRTSNTTLIQSTNILIQEYEISLQEKIIYIFYDGFEKRMTIVRRKGSLTLMLIKRKYVLEPLTFFILTYVCIKYYLPLVNTTEVFPKLLSNYAEGCILMNV